MKTNVMVGAWTAYSDEISASEMDVFNKAFEGFVGVKYSPLAVSTQVVSGMNYRFFCNAQGVYPDARHQAAIVQIYQAIGEAPVIFSIKMCD